MIKKYIRVRTQFQGFHCYPDASKIDERIEFLEHPHRHLFKVEVKISVHHSERELEFFLVKWELEDIIKKYIITTGYMSCEQHAELILEHLKEIYSFNRYYEVTVSEDGESDGIVEYLPPSGHIYYRGDLIE